MTYLSAAVKLVRSIYGRTRGMFISSKTENPTRAHYSEEVKSLVRTRYRDCRRVEEKEALARELGIGSVAKLYNLASRLGAAGA